MGISNPRFLDHLKSLGKKSHYGILIFFSNKIITKKKQGPDDGSTENYFRGNGERKKEKKKVLEKIEERSVTKKHTYEGS